ncbi:hypothetical protein TBLA_0C06210 [Henningerozyma blattae CBS 6284]|uniref:FAS1 domain-containing protein n=1 Tax=Henningerozyma blattae (strain ATCC 34711 / CBS 6284 / DSM 70876 / NBRC 10599 / NRRL Y-10934 / UCD 77-7) TaxID=1071380 RepID=I2H215_HENB6|nr:hypothetical protein TBLA_0C06210 [Tetrapisispora blattae CBS 6284]CCH60417.1 hypothetical protein TBLA_0C06210 [Tetrapisispora blattae CBS 6284]
MRGPLILQFIISLLAICQVIVGNEDFPFKYVIDILSENVEFSTFLRLIQRNGYVDYLNSLTNFTLLAPINSGFIESKGQFDLKRYIIFDQVIKSDEFEDGIKMEYLKDKMPYPIVFDYDSEKKIMMINGDEENVILEKDLVPNFQNSVIHGISREINKPMRLVEILKSLDINNEIMIAILMKRLEQQHMSETNGRTLLIPVDEVFSRQFNEIELNYLIDKYTRLDKNQRWQRDISKLIGSITIGDVIGGRDFEGKVKNLNNDELKLENQGNGTVMIVDGHDSVSKYSNLLFDTGLIHFFNEYEGFDITFDAEKYLHGLNSSRFVEELYFRGVESIVQDPELEQTIFISYQNNGYSKASLMYHFLGQRLETLREGIFESKHCGKRETECQRLKITKSKDNNDNEYRINDQFVVRDKGYHIGKSSIYLMTNDLQLPSEFVSSINPLYGCSKSIYLLNELNLLNFPSNDRGYTIFLPCFDSWKGYELNLEYLQTHQAKLAQVMKSMIFEDLMYSDTQGQLTSTDLNGAQVNVNATRQNDKVHFQIDTFHKNISIETYDDILFNQGVIHPVRQLVLPHATNTTIYDLFDAAGTPEMIEFLEKFSHSLLPELHNGAILVPTATSLLFEGIDINSTSLEEFLKMHVIVENATQNLLSCIPGTPLTTLKSGVQLECRRRNSEFCFIGISGHETWTSGHEVRILRRGHAQGTWVFLVDRPLSLRWLHVPQSRWPLQFLWSSPVMMWITGLGVAAACAGAVTWCVLPMSKRHVDTPRHVHGEQQPLLTSGPGQIQNPDLISSSEIGYAVSPGQGLAANSHGAITSADVSESC